ncbi:MAG TPA: ATP-binding cassette domain-containing protein [Polyangiaceae bacterium]
MKGRSFFVPEVIQTSLMDCGPAALKAVLQGFGVDVSYEWLRARCQTDVDGTSIDALARLAGELGLEANEVLAPRDALFLPEADNLPAIVLTRPGGGLLHFCVVWSMLGPFVQIMDPGGGRRWVRKEEFLTSVSLHPLPMPARRWRDWAEGEDCVRPLEARMSALGVGKSARKDLLARAQGDTSWKTFACLDAAVRMAAALVRSGAVARGGEAARTLDALLDDVLIAPDRFDVIPGPFWWASPSKERGVLELQGTLLVHFSRSDARLPSTAGEGARRPLTPPAPVADAPTVGPALPRSVAEELARPRVSPLRLLLASVRADVPRILTILAVTALLSGLIAAADVLVLRGLFDTTRYLTVRYQRVSGIVSLLPFLLGALALQVYAGAVVTRAGRALDVRLRAALLEKLPRLDDAYLRSRPTSDLAARGHAIHALRQAPALASRLASAFASYAVTVGAIALLEPSLGGLALAAAVLGLAVPYVIRKPLAESTMRLSTHAGALDRFYLDALVGAIPARVHGADLALRREHESLLVEWIRTARTIQTQSGWMRAAQASIGTILAAAIVAAFVLSGGPPARVLLLAFLALQLPALGEQVVTSLVAARSLSNVTLRLFAPLAGRESGVAGDAPEDDEEAPPTVPDGGVAIALKGVTARAGGHTLVKDLNLQIAPGTHVAMVGASGAGKSSLVSLLLGFLDPSEGEITIDGLPLDARRLARLRRETVWVDPSVALWNRSLVDNLTFGADEAAGARASQAVDAADLARVLERLPDGLQTILGERGARLSGGQGQRVRLARGLLKDGVRLVILDEPFRGLERDRRRALLARVREIWRGATVILVSHDVSDVLDLDRALVVDCGEVVEDGPPGELARRAGSRFRALAHADAALYDALFGGAEWRRVRLDDGRAEEVSA